MVFVEECGSRLGDDPCLSELGCSLCKVHRSPVFFAFNGDDQKVSAGGGVLRIAEILEFGLCTEVDHAFYPVILYFLKFGSGKLFRGT